ncbi:unnamed protein product [Hymenolepis diminuta]|uniref:Uncharacterized protein n=1 Tax=Hymenolepis diminuta TaxID=6216 RepID=A0A0R3SWF0_HYMDI|nr:unnamed protein product [Hymenolepis diminuta]
MIGQNNDITFRDLDEEYRRMDMDYVRRIATLSRKKNRQKYFKQETCHTADYATKWTVTEIVLSELTFAMSVERKSMKKRNARAV